MVCCPRTPLNRLPDTNGRARHTHDITTARGLVKMAGSEVRIVHLSGHQGAITYQLVVPAALERVLVLDASFLVRSLGHVGSNVVLAEGATPPDIRYPDLEIHHYYSRSGRSYIEHRDSKKLVARIAEWIHREVGPGEFINIHTFKTRKGQTDVKADLLRKLEEHGVNTDMINVITFGSNQGSNEFSAASTPSSMASSSAPSCPWPLRSSVNRSRSRHPWRTWMTYIFARWSCCCISASGGRPYV